MDIIYLIFIQILGIVPIVPGGIPGMALLPQQPGAPPIMVPIIPSTGAHLINQQQQQMRLAVAHAQAAAAAHAIRVLSYIIPFKYFVPFVYLNFPFPGLHVVY